MTWGLNNGTWADGMACTQFSKLKVTKTTRPLPKCPQEELGFGKVRPGFFTPPSFALSRQLPAEAHHPQDDASHGLHAAIDTVIGEVFLLASQHGR
jgi:hypothetical protein